MRLTIVGVLIGLGMTVCAWAADSDGELKAIFDGKDLTGWKVPQNNTWWSVEDGVLVGQYDEKLNGSMLYTEKSYKDVIVEAEVRWYGEIDSGIMVRKPECQLQIGISRSLKKDMTCSLYIHGKYPEAARAKNVDRLLKVGDWNKIRFQAKGDNFKVWLNGEQVVDHSDPAFPNAAPIGLQVHPGVKMKVEFRNIKAKAIE